MTKPHKIGLALSGGGARGIAHIGALQALVEHDIHPACLAGTSAGSIVGALYAAGVEPYEMLEIMKKYDSIFKVVSFGLPTTGLTKLTRLHEILKKYIPENSFEALEKPFHAAIVNLNSGELEVRNSGELHKVVVASCAIPIVFESVQIDGNTYVDGGLTMNLPVSPIRPLCDYVIGVDVMPMLPAKNKELDGLRDIGMRCFQISIAHNTAPEAALCDVLIETPEVNEFSVFTLSQIDDIFNVGYRATMRKLPEIRAVLAS